QAVEVRVGLEAPHEISVRGEVEESYLFGPHLRLTTTYTTVPGSNKVVIHDVVENGGAQAAGKQLPYQLHLGPPVREGGSRVLAPIREVAPQPPRAAEGVGTLEGYGPPQAGFAEQVYLYDLLADAHGRTLAVLLNAHADRAVALRFTKSELPCFTVWK